MLLAPKLLGGLALSTVIRRKEISINQQPRRFIDP